MIQTNLQKTLEAHTQQFDRAGEIEEKDEDD